MTKEDFLFLMGDEPGTDESFVDSFLMKRTPPVPVEITKTGNPISIETNLAQNALDLQISFSPKQSGSGTPSPDNVRPIVPWTALTLTKNGVDTSYSLGGSYYGGTLDVVTGTLTVDRVSIIIDPSKIQESVNIYFLTISDMLSGNRIDGICDRFQTVSGSGSFGVRFGSNNKNVYFYLLKENIPEITDLASCKEWFSDNPTRICYPLATPITVSLTPSEVALLAGNNTLATDGDSVTVTYIGYNHRRLSDGIENLGHHDQESPDDVLSSE